MSGSLLIRPMEAVDLEAVLAIENASAPHPWTAGIFADELAQRDARRYVVAVEDGRVVGSAACCCHSMKGTSPMLPLIQRCAGAATPMP
jgi:hypothetical protein